MTKVSIIVPVYNTEKYLRKCLISLVNQTLHDIEIICVNDGSTDNSLAVLNEFAKKDARIKVIVKENEGQSAARNLAIQQAQGEFLGFVDSDDWVDLKYFEELYNTAKKYNCDIACAGFKRCKKHRASIKKKFKKSAVYSDINAKAAIDNLPDHNYIWNKIFKRQSWLNTKITFPQGRYFEDVAVLIKIMYYMGDLVTVPKVFYYYRQNPASTVASSSPKHHEDFRIAKKELLDFAKEKNITLKQNRMWLKKVYFKLFGLPILKVCYYNQIIKCKLFGLITFLTVYVKK